jgi:microcystin-dependent protein
MNRIDLFKYPRFPLSSETIDFLQQMAVMMAKAAGIGGDNYILSGCINTGGNVSDGIVVIAGEVMPFIGGVSTSYIVVEEIYRSVIAEGQVYNDIYITRQARFGTGPNQLAWDIFKPVLTIAALELKIATVIPSGVVVMWAGTDVPQGWHLCDGADGTPDLRGRFIVGHSESDLDFGNIANVGGAKKVALTVAQMPAHTHTYNAPNAPGAHPGGDNGYDRPNGMQASTTGSKGNGDVHENLPPYYVLAFIIKL